MSKTLAKKLNFTLNHWGIALPVILITSALAIHNFTQYSLSGDEFYSAVVAGIAFDSDLAPISIVDRLWSNGPDHMPGYFLLLGAWGHLVADDIVVARVPAIYCALLSLAITYRLARDIFTPVAGLIALSIISANTFYNFYYDIVRMYSFVVFCTGCLLWLYWRISERQKRISARLALALTAAVAALVSLHILNALFLLGALSLFHLLFAKRTRNWLALPVIIGAVILCLSPLIVTVAGGGLNRWENRGSPHEIINGAAYAASHLNVMLNNQPWLLLPAIGGLIIARRRRQSGWTMSFFLIWLMGLLVLTLGFSLVQRFGIKHIRYSLSLMLPMILFMAASWLALFRWRRWTLLIIPLWLIAAVAFQQSGEWRQYLTQGRSASLGRIPAPTISRMASAEQLKPHILIYSDASHRYWLDDYHFGHRVGEYYFERHGISAKPLFQDFESPGFDAVKSPSVWITYQTSIAAPDISWLFPAMRERHYQLCHAENMLNATVLLQFRWETLDCEYPPVQLQSGKSERFAYQFFGANVNDDGSKLLFVDQWRAQETGSLARYKMSWQLWNADRERVKGLDLPFIHEGEFRHFALDIIGVPPGKYRLIAIVYDAESGRTVPWLDDAGRLSEELELTEVII